MTVLDFLAGFFLMNAMPHFVLGVWRGRMLSIFGMGPKANIAYGLLNFTASLALFVASHGVGGLATHGLYAGSLALLLIYFATGHFFHRLFTKPSPQDPTVSRPSAVTS